MKFFEHKKESNFKRYVQLEKPIDLEKINDIYTYNSNFKESKISK